MNHAIDPAVGVVVVVVVVVVALVVVVVVLVVAPSPVVVVVAAAAAGAAGDAGLAALSLDRCCYLGDRDAQCSSWPTVVR